MKTDFLPGTIVIINGGRYHGQGAQVRKVSEDKRSAEVMIAGKVRKLLIERLQK